MKAVVFGAVAVVAFIVIIWLCSTFKAMKDPDVRAASKLGIPINRFRKYKEWYDEDQRLMRQYGVDSKEAYTYFASFFKQIEYPNEWRKYQQFRYDESLKSCKSFYDEIFNKYK